MSRYNGQLIATAIRPDAKLGKLTTNVIGKHFAKDDGVDAWNLVEIPPLQLSVTEADYQKGNAYKQTYFVGEDVTRAMVCIERCFPNVKTVVVQNADGVVLDLDYLIGTLQGVTFIVPNTFLSAYQSAYPTLTFSTWTKDVITTIPYIQGASTTLTAEYVRAFAQMSGGVDANQVTKVIVPVGFTEYESGSIQAIIDNFPSLAMFKTCYEKGDIDLDMSSDIVASIDDLDAALVWARSYSSSNNGQVTNLYDYAGHPIYPPLVIMRDFFFERTTKNRLISNMIMTSETGSLWLSANQNWVSLQITFKKSQTNYANFIFAVPNTLKYIKLNNLDRSVDISGSALFTRQALLDFRDSLADLTGQTGATLTMGATNLAKLTAGDIAGFTAKNWTVQ